jgi:undecaprenyl diphosphate synthase
MAESENQSTFARMPKHIGIIMDGNGRWAKARFLPRMAGHRAGTNNIRRIVDAFIEFGIPYLTVYAFSTENWQRPSDEVSGLMSLLNEMLDTEIQELHERASACCTSDAWSISLRLQKTKSNMLSISPKTIKS